MVQLGASSVKDYNCDVERLNPLLKTQIAVAGDEYVKVACFSQQVTIREAGPAHLLR